MEAEDVIVKLAILRPPTTTLDLEGNAILDIYDPSEGHLLELMQAQDTFHGEYGGLSDGCLHFTYFDQAEGGSVLHFEDYTSEYLRVLISLVPEWVWRGTSLSLVMPGVSGLEYVDQDEDEDEDEDPGQQLVSA
jgi:hypothetical protein